MVGIDSLQDAATIRDHSRSLGPDILPDVPVQQAGGVTWVYAPGQFELARLHRLVREGFAANRFVHYASNFGAVHPLMLFRRALRAEGGGLTLLATGELELRVDGHDIAPVREGNTVRAVLPGGSVLVVTARAGERSPATFAVRDEAVFLPGSRWEVSHEGDSWVDAGVRLGGPEEPPHLDREPTVPVPVRRGQDGVYEVDAPVLGRPVLRCAGVPRISTGESREEALADQGAHESRHEVVRLPDGRWTSAHQLGFRFLVVHDVAPVEIHVEASAHPVPRRGAFLCSDERLSRIWATSAYTLRLCMHELMLDGIKRDRMPWIGDQALNTLSNAYAFADARIANDSAAALGRPRHGYVNGISDYSLWWVINAALCTRYFGRPAAPDAAVLQGFLEHLAGYADEEGLFRPRSEPDGFADAAEGSVFIDWGVRVAAGRPYTGLQLLWFWALRSGTALLTAAGHPSAPRWESLAQRVRSTLVARAWDEDEGAWTEYLDEPGTRSSYPNFLAVLSGIHGARTPESVRSALGSAPLPKTPFMASFALLGLARAGGAAEAVSRISALWGAMLDAGARTFWEEFPSGAEEPYAMYGRPFGKSLCHAWAAGPAALLPEIVLGIQPLEDGWTRFRVDPSLGSLDWAAAVVPVPHGEVSVVVRNGVVTVDVPHGSVLVRGDEEWHGPGRTSWALS